MHPLYEMMKKELGFYEVPEERRVDLQNIIAGIVQRVAEFLGEPVWNEYQDAGVVTEFEGQLFGDEEAIEQVEKGGFEYMVFRRKKGD